MSDAGGAAGPARPRDRPPILAGLVYQHGAYPDELMRRAVARCRSRGVALAGIMQRRADDARHRCDMRLEDLATGRRISIFENRGRAARGCRMNASALLDVVGPIERQLDHRPALMVLNKFGKAEAEGGGLCDLIASAVGRQIPVLVPVPSCNLPAWQAFSGGLSIELPDPAGLDDWLAAILPAAVLRSPSIESSV